MLRTIMLRSALAAGMLLPSAAAAQDAAPGDGPNDGLGDGSGLMREGLRMMLEGFGAEMAPALDRLRALTDQLDAYEAPEMLPNGDIIIRRKVPLDGTEPAPDAPLEELEL